MHFHEERKEKKRKAKKKTCMKTFILYHIIEDRDGVRAVRVEVEVEVERRIENSGVSPE